MKKRVLAIMLACLMLVSLLPMGALAAGEELECPGKGKNHYLNECPAEYVETINPTCGDEKSFGYDLYICLECGDYFAANFVQGNKNEKHDYVLVEDKDGYCAEYKCSKCGHVDEEKGHDWADATCDAPKTCKVCGKTDGKPAGHKWGDAPSSILVDPNEATFESGWAEYTCSVCKETKTVEILAHKCEEKLVKVEAKAATCVENGNIEHYACSVCDRLFAYNKDGKLVEVTADDVTITGKHSVPTKTVEGTKNFEGYLYGYTAGTLTFVSTYAGYVETDNFYLEVIPGESYTLKLSNGSAYYFWSTDYDSENDLWLTEVKYTAVVEDSSKIKVTEADCDSTGLKEYTCTVCKEEVKEVLPVAHEWIIDHEVEAGCDTYGYIVYVCELCGENKFEVLKPAGHSERPADATYYGPTCTENGYYVWACTKCGWAQEEVPGTALGHDLKTVVVESTCTTYGYTYTYCCRVLEDYYGEGYDAGCQDYRYIGVISTTIPFDVNGDNKIDKGETKEISINLGEMLPIVEYKIHTDAGFSKTNHAEPANAVAVIKEPTCTTAGIKAFWCANCSKDVVEIIPALGHKKAEKPVTVPATCQSKGYVAYLCTVCGQIAELVEELTYTNEVIYSSLAEIQAQHVDKHGNSTLACTGQWLPDDFDGCPNVGMTRWECSLCKEVMLVKGEHVAPANLPDRYIVKSYTLNPMENYVQVQNPLFGYEGKLSYTVSLSGVAADEYELMVMPDGSEGLGAELDVLYIYASFYVWNPSASITVTLYFEAVDQFKAAAPTCDMNGWTAQFYCTQCGAFVESETYEVLETDKDGKPTKELHPELKALGHDKVVLVEAIKDTCTTVGRTEGWFCKTCGYEEKSVEVDNIKGHALVAADGTPFSVDPISGVYCVCANGCGYEAILDFNRICDHDWVLDRKASSASTCTKAGADVYICSVCGGKKVVELELAAHVNKAGEIILACSETPEDRKCVNCETEIKYNGKGHEIVSTVYEANCLHPAYLMVTCACVGCDYAVAYEYGEPTGHAWKWEAYVKDEKTGVIVGGAYRCETCGKTEIRSLNNIAFSFSIENAANAKGEITDGSLVKVTVAVTGKADSVWGFKFDVPFSSNMTLVKTNYCVDVSDEFVIYGNSNTDKDTKESWITIAGNANGSADVAIDGTLKLVELYFVVDQDVPGVVSVDVENVEVLNYKGEVVGFIAEGEEAKTVALMDVNVDGKLDMSDILATYKLIVDGKYAAAADIDKNGVVEAADLQAMYKYLIGAKTYAATRKTGIAAV